EEALWLLEPALEKGGKTLLSLAQADRNLDPLRDDPRFQRMLSTASARLGASAPSLSPAGASVPLHS
ncbi:MAG: TPR end-of-group domain-containing protein, partial [Sphingomicrobium sp.]